MVGTASSHMVVVTLALKCVSDPFEVCQVSCLPVSVGSFCALLVSNDTANDTANDS